MSGIDYRGFKFPKAAPRRDEAYRKFVRSQICAVLGNDCEGVTECAHLETLGRGIKADDRFTAPLCTAHHAEQHRVGIAYFQESHGVNLWQVACRLIAKWMDRAR